MVYPHYPDPHQDAVPWPTGYDDQDHLRPKRSPLLVGSIAGVVTVLVLAVGILLGLQFSRSPQQQPLPSSPSPSAGASANGGVTPTQSEPTEQRRPEDTARLDRSTYASLGAREFALMAKDPDSWIGRKVVVYGVVTQFDAATGPTTFRAATGPAPVDSRSDYDQNTLVTAHDAGMVANIVENDVVTMYGVVSGAVTYDTQIGGKTTVPSLLVNIIEPTALTAQTPTEQPLPTPAPSDQAVGQLRAIAASDQPYVLSMLADRWVPQLSSKRVGLVAEGRTWTNALILAEHQQLRQTYSNVRLLWSADWSTFSGSEFWVTIVGSGFATADEALAWCRSNGFDHDHCFAKLISTTHPVEGSTAYSE
jgi:cytoskeletal protein RodZ